MIIIALLLSGIVVGGSSRPSTRKGDGMTKGILISVAVVLSLLIAWFLFNAFLVEGSP